MANHDNLSNMIDLDISLLDLKTTFQRKFFTVDGVKYELRSMEEFSFREQKAFVRQGKIMSDGMKDESEATDDVPAMALDQVLQKIVIDPGELLKKLTDNQKVKVLNAFLEEEGLLKKDERSPETTKTPSESPASSVSTEAAPATG